MGLCLTLPCCLDDSDYDFKCKYCEKNLPRNQEELFLLQGEEEDFIFCSLNCRNNFNFSSSSFYNLMHTSQQQLLPLR